VEKRIRAAVVCNFFFLTLLQSFISLHEDYGMAETSEDEKSWSDQVEEYEDEKSAFLPSIVVLRSPPPKRNAALNNLFALIAPKRNADMLSMPKPTQARHHASEPIKSPRAQSPSPKAQHHASELAKSPYPKYYANPE